MASGELPENGGGLVHRLWDRFAPDLRDALSLAYNQARREGKDRISTRTFFAAVARLRPGLLAQLLDQLPPGALPAPISANVPQESSILQEAPQLSTCVEGSLLHLAEGADAEHRLSVAEVFVDVAKHGRGASVAQLREHGITPEKLDQLVEACGWEIRGR